MKDIEGLPSLPTVMTKILEVIGNSGSAAKDLADATSKDQALTAKVLKLVNSSFYGFSTKISTVSRAVVILGYNTIKNLVLGLSVIGIFQDGKEGDYFNRTEFWEHSLGCAACAKLIATRIRYNLPEEAFVAGLIHDIGKMIFDEYFKDDFGQVLELVRKDNIPIIEAEDRVLGVTHAIIGEWLAKKWKLPLVLCNAIKYHHQPPLSSKTIDEASITCSIVVHISDTLCKMGGIGSGGDNHIPSIGGHMWRRINLEESSKESILLQINQELEKARLFFGISREAEID